MVFLVGEQGEAFVAAFVASVSLCGAAPLQTQTYLVVKQGNCGKQILRLVSSFRGDFFPLPRSTRYLFFSVISRPEIPPPRLESPALVFIRCAIISIYLFSISPCSSDHPSYLLSPQKLKKTKIWSKPIHPPPSRFPIPGTFIWYQSSRLALVPGFTA